MAAPLLSGVRSKESRAILKAAQRQGVVITWRKSGHLKLVLPNGRTLTAAASTSDRNAHKNLRSDLRREGINV